VFLELGGFSTSNLKYDISSNLRTTVLGSRPHSKRRIPTLAFTKSQDIGWHVNYRDPQSGVPRRRRFGLIDQNQASELYNAWLAEHLKGAPHRGREKIRTPAQVKETDAKAAQVTPGSLLHVSSNYLYFEEKRTRKPGEPRRSGTISASGLPSISSMLRTF
jgi:hypothetical protein